MENRLKKTKNRVKINLSYSWANIFPQEPGVYVAWEEGERNPVYVGETGNVRGRMKDLLDSRHHTLRRNIGKNNFSKEAGYRDANSKNKFPEHIEKKVDEWLEKKIRLSIILTKLGRKELEELLCEKYKPKYNIKGRRKTV